MVWNWTTKRTAGELIKKHEPFILNTMSAKRYVKGDRVDAGRINAMWAIQDIIDKSRESDLYVVYSYFTPIGWVEMDKPGATWTCPDLFYTITTKRHQDILTAVISS